MNQQIYFDFSLTQTSIYLDSLNEQIGGGEDFLAFSKETNINKTDFANVINYCFTHQYVEQRTMGGLKYQDVWLTAEGMARAVSCEKAKYSKPIDTSGSTFSGSIIAPNSNIQVGDNNSQDIIQNALNHIINKIDKAESSAQDKKEAKNLLNNFLAHPITSNIISAATVAGAKALLGN